MSTATRLEFDAVFEAGVFRPLSPPALADGARVHLLVDAPAVTTSDPIELAGRVYDGLPPAEVDALEALILDRTNFSNRSSS